MAERLRHNIEGRLWKGSDVVTTRPIILNQSQSTAVIVVITPDSLRPHDSFFPKSPDSLQVSTRSRLAQVGLEVHGINKDSVPQDVRASWKNLNGNMLTFEAAVDVTNHCKRPIRLDKDFPMFRFFHESSDSVLKGKTLASIFAEGSLRIEGEEGADWELSHRNGLFVRINSQGRKWIPPDRDNKPIVIDDSTLEGVDYRGKLDPLLRPIPRVEEKILWIGETPRITLSEDLEVILGKSAFHDYRDIRGDTTGIQINSRLIDGGKTDWAIRVEILSPTNPDKMPNFVHMRVVKNGYK